MLTITIAVEVDEDDVTRAMEVAEAAGFAGSLQSDIAPRQAGGITLQFVITYPMAENDGSGPEQREAIDHLHAAMSSADIEFLHISNGVMIGSGANSKWVVRERGSTDPSQSLTIFAVDREAFERQLGLLLPGLNYDGLSVDVFGIAVNDDDVQQEPFTLHRD